jgi:Ca2+-binding RTX toxin-like protein
MANVTVTGVAGRTATIAYDTNKNFVLAAQIAAAINAAVQGGSERPGDNAFGPPPPLGGKQGLFTQSLPGVTMLPRGYADVVDSASSAIIFGSGDANEHVLAGAGNLTFFGRGGSGTVVTGAGNNSINIPVGTSGNWNIQTGNGGNTIVDLGTGADTIAAGAGHNAITLGGGAYQVISTGSDTITAATGAATIDASGASPGGGVLIFGNAANLTFVGGAGAATVFGGSGSDTITGGSGPLYARGGSAGNNVLFGGTGPATLFGGGDGDVLTAAGAMPQSLLASTGSETLTGGNATGADTFTGGSGKDQITGGLGANTFVAGTGQETINAAGSSNLFQLIKGAGGGSTLVTNFTDASQVHIMLSGFAPGEASNAVATQTSTPSSVTATLSDGTSITFANITHLSAGNFS